LANDELVICGLKAVRSRFEADSDSVRRLFYKAEIAPQIGDICKWMARERLAYRCVENDELERISGSIHHGGIAVVVSRPRLEQPHPDEVRQWARTRETILILDRIGNVHNLGAIIRSAAFFGVSKVILPNHPDAAIPTEATYRVAEGGLDYVKVYCVDHLPSFLEWLRSLYLILGAATRGGATKFPSRADRPIALVLGNEEEGLAREVTDRCEALVTIQGSDQVESLNVSATAAIMLWECSKITRQQ
jgi:TrmH RNA methyltransferase